MAGGSGRQRAGGPANGPPNGGNSGNGYNGGQSPQQYQGPPQGQRQQYQQPGAATLSPFPPKPRSNEFDGPGEHSRHPSNMSQGPPQGGSGQRSSPMPSPRGSPLMLAGTPISGSGSPRMAGSVMQQQPSQQRPNPFGPGLGHDPARLAPVAKPMSNAITNTRMEIPQAAYRAEYNFPANLPTRPGLNTTGKQITIRVNQFKVAQWPQQDIYQYDINIGNGAEKRGKVYAVWHSNKVKATLKSLIPPGASWLWDGNKIAWCGTQLSEQKILLDFDLDKGKPQRSPPDQCLVVIRPAKVVRMAVIKAYLDKQMPWDNSVLEAINFLDHVMRQWPSEQYTQIKRSFFARGGTSNSLDNVVVAMKGVYASMRLCDPNSSSGPSTGLAVNVDVANGTFWAAQDVHQCARNYLKERNRNASYQVFRDLLLPTRDARTGGYTMSEDFKNLRKLTKLKFICKHRGKGDDSKQYAIKKFTFQASQTGANAKNTTFKWKNRANGSREEDISVYDYFKRTYQMDLQFWQLPLIITERAGMFPMEVCSLVPNQRYNFKLSPDQTAAMIKFAVTRPKQRIESINHGVGMLKWNLDPYLKHFNLKMDPNMTLTQARLLPNPEIQFTGSKINPGLAGRWDLRGKKFSVSNPEDLMSWGFVVIGGCAQEAVVRNFINVFVQTYVGHGGKVKNKNPVVYIQPRGEDLAATVAAARTAAGNQANALPQILFYVLPGRDSFMYERLKKNSECRFSLVSQCLNIAHVQKAQPQYCSNVCMKVNAKLGGSTSRLVTPASVKGNFPRPTMIIGADVSHAAPGSPQASMAAITMSMDGNACRYAAAVQTNGIRVEMISPNNIKNMMMPLFRHWVSKLGQGKVPQHIYYFRDGVSEGQYMHVLDREVADMKRVIAEDYPETAASIKWTVTVCTKRHHIRFFPKEGDSASADKNNNSHPGTLVERDVTHPFEYDFYLCSHSAIQGTARPVHYHVLLDEAKLNPNDFQKMVYQHSYQYMRSTTPVSLFPAIYYAHLASNRARAHESAPASDGPRGGQKFNERLADEREQQGRGRSIENTSNSGSTVLPTEAAPLLPLGGPENHDAMVKIRTGMWYI